MIELAKTTVLYTGKNKFGDITQLIHSEAGQEIAGAGTRPTAEKWGVISQSKDGTSYGQWYNNEAEAYARADVVIVKAA